LKGSAAQYGINKLVEVCHGFETEISEKKITLGEQVILAEIVKIESAFQEYLEFAKRYLSQTVVNGVKTREIAESDLNFFYQEIMRSDKETILKIFKERFLLVPFSSLLSAYDELCQNLANQLGKSVLPLQIYGGEILVSKDELTPLTQQFIHVFGKSPEGLISIYVSENNSSYDITIKDDGKGISPLAIKEKMKKLNYPETEMILGDEFIIQHIFDAAFSTKEEVSDISGRGAGMDALKDLCVSNGGTVFVESVVGSGTTFFINFPRKSGPV
jgi:chemotaxis protein histidine kinase CheA